MDCLKPTEKLGIDEKTLNELLKIFDKYYSKPQGHNAILWGEFEAFVIGFKLCHLKYQELLEPIRNPNFQFIKNEKEFEQTPQGEVTFDSSFVQKDNKPLEFTPGLSIGLQKEKKDKGPYLDPNRDKEKT